MTRALVLDQGGQVGVVGLDVVLPGLLVHVGLGHIELLTVILGQAFRLFPVFDGPVGLLLVDLFERAQVLQLYQLHVGVVLLRRDLTIDVALLHQGLDFPVGFLLFLDSEFVGLLLLLALGLAVLRLDGQALLV